MKVILTPTAAEHFRNALQYIKRKHGVGQMMRYSALLKTGLAAIPERHYYAAKTSDDFEIQHIEHYYAAYKMLADGTFAVAALLWEGMDIPARLQELKNLSEPEIAALTQKNLH